MSKIAYSKNIVFVSLLICLTNISSGQLDTVSFLSANVSNSVQCQRLCSSYKQCKTSDFNNQTRTCYLYTEEMMNMTERESHQGLVQVDSYKPNTCAGKQCKDGQVCVVTESGKGFICLLGTMCEAPPVTVSMVPETNSKTFVGAEVKYVCNHGYNRTDGNGLSVCLEIKEWSTPFLNCSIIECGTPPVLTHMTVGPVASVTYNSTVIYTCDVGNNLAVTGDGDSVCEGTGRWSTPSLNCPLVDCGTPILLSNMDVDTPPSNTTYQATITYQCDLGYNEISGTGESECLYTGSWSNPSLDCTPQDCGTPPPRPNMNIDAAYLSTTYQANVTYLCETGYSKVSGTSESECLHTGDWSEPTIVCQLVDCGSELPVVPGAQHNSISATTYQSSVSYECDTLGYTPKSGIVSECMHTGNWSTPSLSCEEKERLISVSTTATTQSSLSCETKELTAANSPLTCDQDHVLVDCSVASTERYLTGGVQIVVVGDNVGCKLITGEAVVYRASVRCCKVKGLDCEYYYGPDSGVENDDMSRASCNGDFVLLGCSGSGRNSVVAHDGSRMSSGLCEAANAGFTGESVIAYAACCRAPGLTCEDKSRYTWDSNQQLTCPSDKTMTGCTGFNSWKSVQGSYIEDAGSTVVCHVPNIKAQPSLVQIRCCNV